ncbi:MAG: hypothetical protein KF864_08980 [Phycisphaeraceae bacterium]|nr:hypothetical protein [Phycisphaeraceae bacterium]
MSIITPPTLPPDMPDLPPEPPAWPTVVGTISIVFACLGFCCLGLALLGPQMATMTLSEEELNRGLPPHIALSFGMILIVISGIVLSCVLLAAGILTIKRSAAGRAVHIGYALFAVVQAFVGFFFNHARAAAFQQWIIENPESVFAKGGAGASAGGMIGNVIGLVMGLAYPVFVLVWFLAVKRTAASMLGQADTDLPPAGR